MAVTAAGMAMTAMAASSVASSVSSMSAGRQQAKAIRQQSEYNAEVYEMQATMIEQKKKITDYQSSRKIARMRSTMIAKTSGKGLRLSGSPLAVMADVESEMLFDKAISDYNLSYDRQFALSSAEQTRYSGANRARLARSTGNTNAFSTLLSGASTTAMMYYGSR